MKERILKFKRGPYPKKYTAIIKNKKELKNGNGYYTAKILSHKYLW